MADTPQPGETWTDKETRKIKGYVRYMGAFVPHYSCSLPPLTFPLISIYNA